MGTIIFPILQTEEPGAERLSNFPRIQIHSTSLSNLVLLILCDMKQIAQCEGRDLVLGSLDIKWGRKRGKKIVRQQLQIEQKIITKCAWQWEGKCHTTNTTKSVFGMWEIYTHGCSSKKAF